jgi:spore maturation protein CgeB
MRFVYLTHALTSCWNHGNAHFQRGLLRALIARGHRALALEPHASWSRANLATDQGEAAVAGFGARFPDLRVRRYRTVQEIAAAVAEADVVIVHEWTEPDIVAAVGRMRRDGGRFTLLFHDTHHRAVSDPAALRAFDLEDYDAVLAFGAALADVYEDWGWGGRVFVFHEAADLTLFHPPRVPMARTGAVWVGNWGDGERTAELESFLFRPAQQANVALDVHGVRYPPEALAMLARHGARYHGWLANASAPEVFGRHAFTVHVPRRYYTQVLPGIPTIRVFEALACGIPLICAPWNDSEGLFRPGEDYLVARDGDEMRALMIRLHNEPAFGAALAERGLERVRAHHGCDSRARELLAIVERVAVPVRAKAKGAA